MATATAFLKNYRQSPRKVRLVTDHVKGKHVARALAELSLLPKRSAMPIKKLIESALANAKNMEMEPETLIVKDITVNEGVVLMRRMPRARGSAYPIRKRNSHVMVVLEGASKKAPVVKDETKQSGAKKTAVKKPVARKPKAKAKKAE